jgi:hypothetical protein
MQGRTRRHCAVCGSGELDVDEVLDAGVLRLGECRRCRHRWTERALFAVPALTECADAEVAAAA